jgi:hypothetical protein
MVGVATGSQNVDMYVAIQFLKDRPSLETFTGRQKAGFWAAGKTSVDVMCESR